MSSRSCLGSSTELSVGIADMVVVKSSDRQIVTHALGSCIGLTIFDPVAGVGGLLHYMLDRPRTGGLKEGQSEAMFSTTGIPALFREAYALGAKKERIIACAAGAAEMLNGAGGLKIGARNQLMLRKMFWKNGVVLAAEDTGGNDARTMRIDLGTGEVEIHSRSMRTTLWTP